MAVDTTRKSVFVLGAGFIGTSVIGELRHRNYHVTVLVRRQANSDELSASGLSTVLGSLDDSDLITAQVEISDVVINTASSDHVKAALAILEGIQRRSRRGDDTIYIQTSGTGSLGDFAAGQFKTDTISMDNNPDDINAVPDSNPHRDVDNAITSRQKEIGIRAKVAIILPPLIYGCKFKNWTLSLSLHCLEADRFQTMRDIDATLSTSRCLFASRSRKGTPDTLAMANRLGLQFTSETSPEAL
jgi:hypothetical protein